MVRLRVLGPMAAERDGGELELGGPKQRTVLALLLTGDGHRLDADALIDAMWGEEPPASARSSLQAYVSRLRSVLGDDVLVWDGTGYRLALPDDAVDAWRFVAEAERGRSLLADEPQRAEAVLRGALELWRGPAFAGLDGPLRLDQEARRLDERRLGALADHARARLASGDAASVAGELEARTREHPTHEGLRELHALALYRCGRQAEALDVIDETRRLLRDELGVDLSPRLQELQRRLLDQDPALEGPASAPAGVELPRGTVTFVLAEVEEGARLHHRAGDGYGELLDRYLAILRTTWREHGGHEFGLEEDRERVVFADADEAVRACVAAQHRIHDESWPDGLGLRVRLGAHTGIASPDGGRYVAMALHEAAGVMAAAHGGQVLLSARTVAELTGDVGRLERLGRYRIRGASEPMELFSHRDAPGGLDARPVRAVPVEGHNLARPVTETVGRDDLVSAVLADLAPGRVVTLVGPGGVGKTRVAVEVGIRAADDWRDGAWIVELASVSSTDHLVGSVADAVGAPTVGAAGDRWEDVVAHLGEQSCVLILDNCEHVLEASRDVAEALQQRCPGVAVLATSRSPLHPRGEVLRPVAPLGLPEADDPATVLASPAGRLFTERARAVTVGFDLDGEVAGTVADICRHLDGLPLLIELAAALTPVQTPREILASLTDDLDRLRSRDPRTPSRHGSVEGLIGWSYRLLEPQQQVALRRLSLFGGSFTLETAAVVVGAGGDIASADVPHLVWSLVDRSLVVADLRSSGTRYRLLETVRRPGRRWLREAAETGRSAAALARALLEDLGPGCEADRDWMTAVGDELDNLRMLVSTLPDEAQDLAQEVATTIGRYHDHAHAFRDGARELAGYADTLGQPSAARVGLLCLLADLHLRGGDLPAAERLVDEAALLAQEHGAPPWDEVAVERAKGEIARRGGDLAEAIAIARRALERDLEVRARSRMLNLLGISLAGSGDPVAATAALREELALNRELEDADRIASGHGNLAELALRSGDVRQAAAHQLACLRLALTEGSPAYIAYSLILAARLAGVDGRWDLAVVLQSRADALLDEIGLALYPDDRRACDELLDQARAALGEATYVDGSERGAVLSLDDATSSAEEVLSHLAEDVMSGASGG